MERASGKPLTRPLSHPSPVVGGLFSADGALVATLARDNAVRIWNSVTGELLTDALRHPAPVHDIIFSPDRRVLAAAGDDGLRLWDLSHTPPVARRFMADSPVRCVAYDAKGTHFAAGTAPGEGELLDTRGRVLLWKSGLDHPLAMIELTSRISALAFSPGEDLLAIGASDGAAGVWSVATGAWNFHSVPHPERITSIAFSPDSKWVITAGRDAFVSVLNARTGESRYTALPHGEPVSHAEFSPNGQRLLSLTVSGVLRIWDAESGLPLTERLRDFPSPSVGWTPLGGYSLFSPDSQHALAIGSDLSARVLDVPVVPVPSPAWLPELADAIGGQRRTESRQTVEVTWADYLKLRDRLAAVSAGDFYSRWLRWFFADRGTRTISPWSEQTVADYSSRLVRANTLDSLFEVARLQPTNAVALARLGQAMLLAPPGGLFEPTNTSAFLIRRAREIAPNDPEIRGIAGQAK